MGARSISTSANMAFGRFVAGSGGAITLAPSGARSRSGGVILLTSSTSAAGFSVTGSDNKVTVLSLPADGSVSLVSGANQMPLNGFASNLPPGGVLVGGSQNVTVGATLQVAPNQPAGNYSGTFQATINFQ